MGQIVPGKVTKLVPFGAFVDLGGVDGLVHVSELSWKHIDHPTEVVEAGEASSYSSAAAPKDDAPAEGALASDEALQALREKLTGQG